MKYSIKIFARVRPIKKAVGLYEVGEADNGTPTLSFIIPRSESGGYVNNKKELFSFKFTQVFDQPTKQEEVFDCVARPVVDNCLQGYNGTLFAYGQTGSGKTFTITGGAERYSDRGIIPRTLSYVFQQYQKRPDAMFTTHISYMEIYNDSGYDLLDPKHESSKLEDLPKVTLLEDGDGNVHLKNLSMHQAANEEDALNWLFIGDTNRMIAETPMNMASTRSHCIFTIHISSREPGEDTIRRAKLHLVDLAGSERVGKTGVRGTQFVEARYINLSLHSLEQVIVALSEKSRTHIPYRNSMMTSVLRDSLGGNCMTTMIATLSVEKRNIDETITTCRFAQRVALIKNEAVLNEELDPKLMVARLKQQVQELREELNLATGEERTDELTSDERDGVKRLVKSYLEDDSPEAYLGVGADMRKIQLCFQIMKRSIQELQQRQTRTVPEQSTGEECSSAGSQQLISSSPSLPAAASTVELEKLTNRLKQRDDEINVLLKMLKQERRRVAEAESVLRENGTVVEWSTNRRSLSPITGRTSPLQLDSGHSFGQQGEANREDLGSSLSSRHREHYSRANLASSTSSSSDIPPSSGLMATKRAALRAELSQARQEAFDMFRKEIADNGVIEQHKRVLKTKYAEAKSLGESVNSSRVTINKLKSQLEKHRLIKGVHGPREGTPPNVVDPEEEQLKESLETEKLSFKKLYNQLKSLKTEIEHVQHLLERAKVQLQRDFEEWWTKQTTKGASPTKSSSSFRSSRRFAAQFSSSASSSLKHAASSPDNISDTSTVSQHSKLWRNPSSIEELAVSRTQQDRVSTASSSGGSTQLSEETNSHSLSRKSYSRSKKSPSLKDKSIPLTGDARADADIIAFYKARQKLIT